MNQLDSIQRAQVIAALVEGNSIRSVSRMTGIARNTISTLLFMSGAACARYQDEKLRNLPCKRVQCDEIWSFCYAKDRNVPAEKRGELRVRRKIVQTLQPAHTMLCRPEGVIYK